MPGFLSLGVQLELMFVKAREGADVDHSSDRAHGQAQTPSLTRYGSAPPSQT